MTLDINLYRLKCTDGRTYILEINSEDFYGLEHFMNQVIHRKHKRISTTNAIDGAPVTKQSPLGQHLLRLIDYTQSFSRDCVYSPLLAFYFEQCRLPPIKDNLAAMCGYDTHSIARFIECIETLRKNALFYKLKKYVADWESKPEKARKRIGKFERQVFRTCDRITAVRLDLHYYKAIFSPAEIDQIRRDTDNQKKLDQAEYEAGIDISIPKIVDGRVSLAEVQRDRKRLWINMKGKTSLFEHLVASSWLINFNRSAGYWLQLVFFFDASEVPDHVQCARDVGEYICNDIAEGRCYVDYANPDHIKHGDTSAFGLIDRWDYAKREKLVKALQYFCRANQLVQVMPYSGCQFFGTGIVRKPHREKADATSCNGGFHDHQPPGM